eukprot:scaffold83011_cov63-Phaeocystis_antarctica.AAC.3
MRTTAAILALVCTAHAGFVQPLGAGRAARRAVRVSSQPSIVATLSEEPLEPTVVHSVMEHDVVEPEVPMPFNPAYVALGFAAFAALQPEMAMAKGGEYGLAEGRIISLAHPTVMALMCGPPATQTTRMSARSPTPTPRTYTASAFAAFTGLQWRRLREVGVTIGDLKKELKPLQAQVEAAGESGAPAALTAQVAELTTKVDELSATRKALAKDDLRDKHYQVGSVILGLGTSFAIEGPVNTFMRAGKLFPGPHLYAGAGVVVAWAMAASMVPNMAKGAPCPGAPPRRPARRHATPRPKPVGRRYDPPPASSPLLPPVACCRSPQAWRSRPRSSRRQSSPKVSLGSEARSGGREPPTEAPGHSCC